MIRTIVSMPSSFYSDGIIAALDRTGNFRTLNIPPGSEQKIVPACRQTHADVLFMGVSLVQGFKLSDRREIIRQVRSAMPACKIVLFVDDGVSPDQTQGIKDLRFLRQIDDFIYTSCSMDYLVDTLETVV